MEVALEFEFDKAEELRRALIEACGEVKETLLIHRNEYKGNAKLMAGGMYFSDYLGKRQEMLEAKAQAMQLEEDAYDEALGEEDRGSFNMEEVSTVCVCVYRFVQCVFVVYLHYMSFNMEEVSTVCMSACV